jgi:chaperonin GroES
MVWKLAIPLFSTKIRPMKNAQKQTKMRIQPLGDRVLVRPAEVDSKEKTKSGIYIPESSQKEKPSEGEVLAVGDGWYNEDGDLIPLRVKVGDKVIFSKYSYEEVNVDGEDYYILKEENIFAIIK